MAQTAAPSSNERGDRIPNVELSSALMYQLMAAEVAVQRGDIGSAFAVYMKLARGHAIIVWRGVPPSWRCRGAQCRKGWKRAQLWFELAPNSSEASQTLAMLYAGSSRFDDAYSLFTLICRRPPIRQKSCRECSARSHARRIAQVHLL